MQIPDSAISIFVSFDSAAGGSPRQHCWCPHSDKPSINSKATMAMLCYVCGEDALLEVDGSAGNSVCTRCGTVCAFFLPFNLLVSDQVPPQTNRSWKRMLLYQKSLLVKLVVGRRWFREVMLGPIKVCCFF